VRDKHKERIVFQATQYADVLLRNTRPCDANYAIFSILQKFSIFRTAEIDFARKIRAV
jgi:hypothetical protein